MVSNLLTYVKNDWHIGQGNRRTEVVETVWTEQSFLIVAISMALHYCRFEISDLKLFHLCSRLYPT
ncbi:MAG: hypothetical protein DWI22_17790 [Planctomycetota bacterium]|nr:MAG: hypothetical protein DWI22_17790 [Planctomycetota bacterium]